MSDHLDVDSILNAGLLLSNTSTSEYSVIEYKALMGFNISISDLFGIVRLSPPPGFCSLKTHR